ncbi:hypothetical protein E4U43_004059 [Claviceps pusilla]|uniref:Uncharacterized protein n=1 Tax=Claviceps pusilla TaxID=123648 RepID=A0A9P7NHJ0_9HYPO|nr:hypothetical protein E4U43_004059 [Claviceps pusilla]
MEVPYRVFVQWARSFWGSGIPTTDEFQLSTSDGSVETMRGISVLTLKDHEIAIQKALRPLIKKLDEVPINVSEEIKKSWLKSERQLEEKTQEADKLKSDLESLRKKLDQEREASKEKVVAQNALIKQLTDEKKKLREVILSSTTRQKISDEVIKQRFANLRQQIQAIANSAAFDVNRALNHSYPATDDFEMDFQQRYRLYDLPNRVFLIRSKVYEIIQYFILSRDVFGVVSSCENAQKSQKFSTFPNSQNDWETRVEQGLVDFEGHLRAKEVPDNFISDWRLATIKCVETFNSQPKDPTVARDLVWSLLMPLLKPMAEESKIRAEISQLCDDAYNLRLQTRQSEDRYCFRIPDCGIPFDPSKGFVEPLGVIGGGQMSTFVAFPIFGALFKETGKGTENSHCLEPAHVVVQAKEGQESSGAGEGALI